MKISTVLYSLKQGTKNIWRNKMFSLASVATMAACIFLFGIFYSIVVNMQSIVQKAEEGVAVTVFFEEGITDDQIAAIEEAIKSRAEVEKYEYVSAEQAWEDFKETYFEGKEELAEGYEEDNPLANDANFQIYLNDVSMQDSLVTYLESLDGVREVNQSEMAAHTLTDFNSLIAYISIAIIIILLAVSIFLISNTVTVGIAVRKEEIGIMKLIGATDFFVRAPFLFEGILIGIVGSIIPLVILFFLYKRVVAYIIGKFNFLSGIMDFLPAHSVFAVLVPVGLILGIGIGFVGSRLTIHKHLRV
ncbi:permease-like cell division protein FtsX [Eubacterium oxidoreducens]|uniref:Cell division protein FtsX n=1 Tax=Eubacterium oxidoreducens TaxID=1732 RepID=A0A1G6CD82_EUBOX|nr:permease-like cell division protein FtsX [Eubacterium oxidoreducens]SDB30838.1 cell division transport system permease protein [Eubacterium oxidoreducens]